MAIAYKSPQYGYKSPQYGYRKFVLLAIVLLDSKISFILEKRMKKYFNLKMHFAVPVDGHGIALNDAKQNKILNVRKKKKLEKFFKKMFVSELSTI